MSALSEFETPPASKEEDKARFLEVFKTLTAFLISELKERYEVPADGEAWVARMMDYTVPGGKLNRGPCCTPRGSSPTRRREADEAAGFEASALVVRRVAPGVLPGCGR